MGLRVRILGFKLEAGFEVGAPLLDLDDEAQLPLPGEGKRKKSPKTKGQDSCRIPSQKDFFQGGFYWKKSLNWFFSGLLGGEFPLEQVKNGQGLFVDCIEWVEEPQERGERSSIGDPKLSKPGGYKKNVLTKESLLNLSGENPCRFLFLA